ncbi:MarR family winged helix-turn-helix transcriptional regulator [Pararobbsia silviterrae]|uniref:MarR family transcriptional regulator n=1 Tax=Pararobbsia silviterrae TaxID=1792498 RepID=A0A494X9L4_9BURK|nr:MarR family transcriptional regulator [Pararobbsia silviterrae]RKP47170.1 MarR family transcriptional regulator [Pararobbsia silviterrae]
MPAAPLDHSIQEFMQSVGQLVRRIRAQAQSDELSITESLVISRLSNDGPATTADLARAEGVKPQSMGTIVASLEATGFVKREPHPTDGRQMLISLTPKGTAWRKKVRAAKQVWLSHAIARLSEDEQRTLFKAGEIFRKMNELNEHE